MDAQWLTEGRIGYVDGVGPIMWWYTPDGMWFGYPEEGYTEFGPCGSLEEMCDWAKEVWPNIRLDHTYN